MAMNLRENKMDQFDDAHKKKGFFGFGKMQNKLQQGGSSVRVHAPDAHGSTGSENETHKSEWVQKEMDRSLSDTETDYQENYSYIEEHSPYIKQHPENVIVSWRGPEFEHYPHDRQWYIGALLIVCLIILYAIFTDSIIMAIVFVLIAFTGYLFLSRPQKVIDFAITYDGIVAGRDLYRFDDIRSFWIFYEPPHTRIISLHMKDHFRPYLHIPLHQVDPVVIHKKLTDFVPEIKQEQNLVDTFERLLRM
jgi:hypothetical protein